MLAEGTETAITSDLDGPDGYSRTSALRRTLEAGSRGCSTDLLFLSLGSRAVRRAGIALRVHQIRGANPALAAEIRAELKYGRPLTDAERADLLLAT